MNLDIQETLSRFTAFVDPKVGVIRSVELVKLSDADPRAFLAYAEPSDTFPLTSIAAANRGAACAINADRAILRACGECIERYCSAFFEPAELLFASESELNDRHEACIPTAMLYPFATSQYDSPEFPYQPVSASQPLRWVSGSTTTGGRIWIPASCVYVPYRFETGVEPFTHMPISTGLAAGVSVDNCIDKGLCEILERDALMIVWHARMAMPRLDPRSCFGVSDEIDALLTCVMSPRSRWYLNVLTLDIEVPVISAALIDDGAPPYTSLGIAADGDPVKALGAALEEALLTRLLVNRCADQIREHAEDRKDLRTLRDHLMAHAGSDALRTRMGFLTENGPLVTLDEVRASANDRTSVRTACEATGRTAAWVDITTPDIRDMGSRVVRTVMMGMQPLDNDHRYRHLGGERLLSVPRTFGYPIHDISELNSDPHPFP